MTKFSRAAILLFGTAAIARDRADWNNLHDLSAGQKIEVIKRDGQSLKGTFTTVTADTITVQTGPGDATIARSDVSRVRRSSHRTRNTLIGAGIGAGAGAAVGAALGRRL